MSKGEKYLETTGGEWIKVNKDVPTGTFNILLKNNIVIVISVSAGTITILSKKENEKIFNYKCDFSFEHKDDETLAVSFYTNSIKQVEFNRVGKAFDKRVHGEVINLIINLTV